MIWYHPNFHQNFWQRELDFPSPFWGLSVGSCQVGKCKLWPAAMCSLFSDQLLLKEKDASGPLDKRHSGTSNSPEVTTTNAHDALREVENTPVLHQTPELRKLKVDRFSPYSWPWLRALGQDRTCTTTAVTSRQNIPCQRACWFNLSFFFFKYISSWERTLWKL